MCGAQSRDESVGSENVRNGDIPEWTEERIKEVLTAMILGKSYESWDSPNNIPTSPDLAK